MREKLRANDGWYAMIDRPSRIEIFNPRGVMQYVISGACGGDWLRQWRAKFLEEHSGQMALWEAL